MLDLRFVREHPDAVEKAMADRGAAAPLRDLLDTDEARRKALREVEELKARRNKLSQQVAEARRLKLEAATAIEDSRAIGEAISGLEARIRTLDETLAETALKFPNVPHASVPVGHSADENVEVRRWGTARDFGFPPRPHWEIGEVLGILDFERASKIAKSRFAVLWGPGARLERALGQLMLDVHTRERGYREVWVPHLVSRETMIGTAQLPKFEDQLFKTDESGEDRQLFLIPTAEVPLTALHGGEVLAGETLPRKYTAFTPCYRREAGTYGQDTRGMIRQHQFDKVELVKLTARESSYDELETMVADAEAVLQKLALPYRVVLLCTGDLGFASAKTYDLEVWLPSEGRYREISSCSNCEAFQARRAGLRYRPAGGGKPDYLHTLNGSGLAVGRTLIAVLENYQDADATVVVPEALRPYLDGVDRLTAA